MIDAKKRFKGEYFFSKVANAHSDFSTTAEFVRHEVEVWLGKQHAQPCQFEHYDYNNSRVIRVGDDPSGDILHFISPSLRVILAGGELQLVFSDDRMEVFGIGERAEFLLDKLLKTGWHYLKF